MIMVDGVYVSTFPRMEFKYTMLDGVYVPTNAYVYMDIDTLCELIADALRGE